MTEQEEADAVLNGLANIRAFTGAIDSVAQSYWIFHGELCTYYVESQVGRSSGSRSLLDLVSAIECFIELPVPEWVR